MAKRKSGRNDTASRPRNIITAIVVFFLAFAACSTLFVSGGYWVYNNLFSGVSQQGDQQAATGKWAANSAELTVAVSPLMAQVLEQLASDFNAQQQRTPDDQTMRITVAAYDPQAMVEAALSQPSFQAMSPDSSLWLDRLEQKWAQRTGSTTEGQMPIGQTRTAETTRYAVSPIVIATWQDVARQLGWPDKPVSWLDIQRLAQSNPEFKWSHPSTQHASGLLATLAEFYAGAGLTRGLTVESATDQKTLEYVQKIESTVRFYGEGEEVIISKLQAEGRSFLDAFVAQERVVVDWNRTNPSDRLVALYPSEGTFWTDHPLALLELGQQGDEQPVTDNQRLAYRAFAAFLASADAQQQLLASGYRPADLNIALDGAGSPFAKNDAVDWRQPQTTLQIPPAPVVEVVLNAWYYTKRPTNVYLVVDTSGSMEDGDKLERAKNALQAFVAQIKGDRDRVGIVEFGSEIKTMTRLQIMNDDNRAAMLSTISNMEASGGTALIDAVYVAIDDLEARNDREAINAVVVMTDGLENESRNTVYDVQQLLAGVQAAPIIFTIAFGSDADEGLLTTIAEIGGGQFRRATETSIEDLYRVISTYF